MCYINTVGVSKRSVHIKMNTVCILKLCLQTSHQDFSEVLTLQLYKSLPSAMPQLKPWMQNKQQPVLLDWRVPLRQALKLLAYQTGIKELVKEARPLCRLEFTCVFDSPKTEPSDRG